jgi:hypothetical protein
LEKKSKSFHFQEKDWLISFPTEGNEGRKYLYYSVRFTNRKNKQKTQEVCLTEIVGSPEFEDNFPYTVGFFKGSIDEETDLKSVYLEIRIVKSIEEFWKFLNDLNI